MVVKISKIKTYPPDENTRCNIFATIKKYNLVIEIEIDWRLMKQSQRRPLYAHQNHARQIIRKNIEEPQFHYHNGNPVCFKIIKMED